MSVISTAGELACLRIYDPIPAGVFERIYRVGESVVGTKLVDGLYYLVHQGTENVEGWEADFDCAPTYHAVLGNLHTGFNENIDALLAQIAPDIPTGAAIVATGHSKGAGEGSISAAKLKLAGYNVASVVLFACPNSMYERGAAWYAANLPNAVSFRNCSRELPAVGDPVPLVPILPYTAPVKHTPICVPPNGLDAIILTKWHHGALYYNAVSQI